MDQNTQFLIPKGDGTGLIRLDILALGRLEARQAEVSFVTKEKAPELLTALNRGYLDSAKMALMVNQHVLQARQAAELRKSVILLDELEAILTKKGIKSANDDIRKAVLAQDEEHQKLTERVRQLEAVLELLKIKMKGFDNAFTSVKRLLHDPRMMSSAAPSSESLAHDPHHGFDISTLEERKG